MNTEIAHALGWVTFHPTESKLSADKILELLGEKDSFAEMRRSWTPLTSCLLRKGEFVLYFERSTSISRSRFQLRICPSSPEKGDYEISGHGVARKGRIVRLKAEADSTFQHYFWFDSVSSVKNQVENLSWSAALINATKVDDSVDELSIGT